MRKAQQTTCVIETPGVQSENAELSANAGPMQGENQTGASTPGSRIALLTPYNGGNFGDAAIQDAMIANLRVRIPDAHISGITLNSASFLERHGAGGFPLCASRLPFYGMSDVDATSAPRVENRNVADSGGQRVGSNWKSALKGILGEIPGARRVGKRLRSNFATVRGEIRHFLGARLFLRSQDLLIVSGGGQLDEEWGGPWGHPFSLLKWAVLAKLVRVPFAIVSVGTGKAASPVSRMFFATALRLAGYRSFRDVNSRSIAAKWLAAAGRDDVIPDLAFSLPSLAPARTNLRLVANGRPIVALSPIAYAKPGSWPRQDQAVYDRYRHQMAQVVSGLVESGYFVAVVWSSAGDDEKIFSEIMDCLDPETREKAAKQIFLPSISNWKELSALLEDVDFLVASRMHSTIIGFLAGTPTVAISFDPKVDWVMQDLEQKEYLLQIGDFTAKQVIHVLANLAQNHATVVEQIASYRARVSPQLSGQYDALAKLATVNRTKPS
jgi:polysaccharide pyruvyl transferase WcaK-like protein